MTTPARKTGPRAAEAAEAEAAEAESTATEFVGRAAELRRVDALLHASRLVTLVGPGGVGKTRLALRGAERADPWFTDGACLVELSALRDPKLLPRTVAACLGLPGEPAVAPLDAVIAALGDRHLLLILDTCEHLIDACALLAEAVIAGTPSVSVLVTSREPLAVPGESCYTVPPFGPPGTAGLGAGDQAAGDWDARDLGGGPGAADAIELFARRASAGASGFQVTDANRADILRICRQLDGIPLAIELAAAELATLPLTELADRLEYRIEHRLEHRPGSRRGRRLELLTSGSPGADGRHRTLRDAIGWSYDLCAPAEQALWARLSVFAGSFDLAAAEEVCASSDLGRDRIFETILRLVDKSVLLHAGPPGGAAADGGQPMRLRMLGIVREFGAERLAASGAETAIRDRHLSRYRSMARHFREHLVGDGQLARFRQLRAEHGNLRAALEYALGPPDGQYERVRDGAQLAIALNGYWVAAGQMREGTYWLGRALDHLTAPSALRAWALTTRCYIGAIQRETERAIADGRESLRLAASLDDPLLTGRGYVNLCLPLAMSGQLEEAAQAGARARRLLTPLTDRVGLILLEAHLGNVAALAGDSEQAIGCYHRGLDLLGGNGMAHAGEGLLHGSLQVMAGFALFRRPGSETECARTLQLALVAKHELGERSGTAYVLEILGWLAARTGHHRRAAWLLGAADSLWKGLGTRFSGTDSLAGKHARVLADGRAALGPERFDSLFACGAGAPLDDMVAFAIADANEPGIGVAPIPLPAALTDREREIAFLVAGGMRADKIAQALFISGPAVRAHLDRVHAKLGVRAPAQLAEWFRADRA